MDVVRYRKVFPNVDEQDYDAGSQLVRWTINAESGTVESSLLSNISQDFPRINEDYECYKHRFGYSVEQGGKHGYMGLLKIDLEFGATEYHDVGENNAASEPVFVSTGEQEDEGYMLSVVFNDSNELSEVRIIDAQNFSSVPLAIIKLNTRVPFGFHGNFIKQ